MLKLRQEELKALADKEEESQKKRAAEQEQEKTTEKVQRKGPQPGEWKVQFFFYRYELLPTKQNAIGL